MPALRFVIIAGPPSSGKTSVMLHTVRHLQQDGILMAACKIDCLETSDDLLYRRLGIPVAVGLSDYICPDHFYVANLEEIRLWAEQQKADVLIVETAGLCHRCAPAVQDCLSICVIDSLVGLDTPQKLGPMLSTADIIVVTKGDIVSQAEREVFHHQVATANNTALIFDINGLNGRGALHLKNAIINSKPVDGITGKKLKYPMPAAICSYCAGEIAVGSTYQMGNIKKIDFGKSDNC